MIDKLVIYQEIINIPNVAIVLVCRNANVTSAMF